MKTMLPLIALTSVLSGQLCTAQTPSPATTPNTSAATPAEQPIPPQGFDKVREGIERGKLERVDYDSTSIGAKRWMEIYTPPGYSADKKYPLFILLHGAGGNENHEWTGPGRNQGGAAIILDNLIADKKMVPMIVVFPNGNATAPAPATPAPAAPAEAAPAANPGQPGAPGARAGGRGGRGLSAGWGKNFENDLFKDIIPYVESHYSVLTDAPHHALAGLSMGGMQTKSINLGNIGKFSHIGIFSGGNIKPEEISDLEGFKKQVKVVFMSYGSRESSAPRGGGTAPAGPEGAKIASEALNAAGVKAIYYVSPDSAHDFTSWKRSLYYFAPLLFKD